jgi:hypothetical protein
MYTQVQEWNKINKIVHYEVTMEKEKLICKKTKMKLYKALIRPVVLYGSECWVLTENIKQKLLVIERKILRRIFGPIQNARGEWRLKTNEELEKKQLIMKIQ